MKKYNGKLIYSIQDAYGSIEVVDTPTLRNLHFGTSIMQSSMFHSDPFALEMEYNQVMMLGLLFNPLPRRALFLGLGGASKPKFLWRYFPEAICEVVELNPHVIDVAYTYFALPQDKRMIVHEQDAAHFLQQLPSERYDFIFIDLYTAEGIAEALSTQTFFEDCKKRLQPGGILIWNIWSVVPESLVGEVKKAFAYHFTLAVQESPNLIVFASNTPFEVKIDPRTLQEQTGMDFTTLSRRLNFFNI